MSIKTHKEQQNFASGYVHEWPTTSVPRDPSFYEPVPAKHKYGWSPFVDMLKSRKISWDIAGETIRNGEVYEAEDDNHYRFLWTDPTTLLTYSLIVELRPEAFAFKQKKHYAVTIYRVER